MEDEDEGGVLEIRWLRDPLSRSRVGRPKSIERYIDTSVGIYGDVSVQENPLWRVHDALGSTTPKIGAL